MTPTWRPQVLQGPQLGGPKPSRDSNLEAPDLEFCLPLQHFSYFFDNSIFSFQNALGLLFLSSWRLLGRLLASTWRLLASTWGLLVPCLGLFGSIFGLLGASLEGPSALGSHFRVQCLPRAQIWRPKGALRIQVWRPKIP